MGLGDGSPVGAGDCSNDSAIATRRTEAVAASVGLPIACFRRPRDFSGQRDAAGFELIELGGTQRQGSSPSVATASVKVAATSGDDTKEFRATLKSCHMTRFVGQGDPFSSVGTIHAFPERHRRHRLGRRGPRERLARRPVVCGFRPWCRRTAALPPHGPLRAELRRDSWALRAAIWAAISCWRRSCLALATSFLLPVSLFDLALLPPLFFTGLVGSHSLGLHLLTLL